MLDKTVLGPPGDANYSASFGLRQEYSYLSLITESTRLSLCRVSINTFDTFVSMTV